MSYAVRQINFFIKQTACEVSFFLRERGMELMMWEGNKSEREFLKVGEW